MSTPKAQTILSKFGFQDDELKTPKHDEIMLWLDQNIEILLIHYLEEIVTIKNKVWEYPLTTDYNNFIVGFIDMLVRIEEHSQQYFCLEVKPTILSLGELIRQIQTYKVHIKNPTTQFIVVSPDDRFVSTLKSQNIGFIKYEP